MKIEMNNITCGYGNNHILKNINLSFDTNQVLLLLGANGIGKTTLFKMFFGEADIVSGELLIDGKKIYQYKQKDLAKIIAYVPQAKNTQYDFSVKDVLLMGRACYIKSFSNPKYHDNEVVERIIQMLEIEGLSRRKYNELSGGQQQMVLVARALVQEPQFLLLDEPASNLDYKNQRQLVDTVTKLKKNEVGVLMSMHNPELALSICEKAIVINPDRSVKMGSIKEIMDEKTLSELYGTEMRILQDETGHMACVIS